MPVRWFVAGLLPCAFATLLVPLRTWYGHGWPWLIVNLLLVLVPLLFAAGVTEHRRHWLALPWLIFFPNAPYVVSDIIHYASRPPVPTWYDAAMLGSLAAAGLFTGALSAVWVMRCLVGSRPAWVRWGAWSLVCLAAGRAIELGRVQRLNSWDLVFSPFQILYDALLPAADPFAHADVWGISLMYAAMIGVWCLTLSLLLPREPPQYARAKIAHSRAGFPVSGHVIPSTESCSSG